MCVCVCVCIYIHTNRHSFKCTSIFIYSCPKVMDGKYVDLYVYGQEKVNSSPDSSISCFNLLRDKSKDKIDFSDSCR